MLKNKIAFFIDKIKKLHGDPHYVAFGMAIGVFIAITPTMPFHTVGAITLALFFKASKPAAIIGAWVSNPFTVVFIYFASYKAGRLFFDDSVNALESIKILINYLEMDIELSQKINYFVDFIQTNIKTFMIMNFGGILLGLPLSLAAYFITKGFFVTLRQKRIAKKKALKK
jgi:uncharacterized protein (DUF2062 family)